MLRKMSRKEQVQFRVGATVIDFPDLIDVARPTLVAFTDVDCRSGGLAGMLTVMAPQAAARLYVHALLPDGTKEHVVTLSGPEGAFPLAMGLAAARPAGTMPTTLEVTKE